MEATLSVSKRTGVGRFRIEGFSLLLRKKGDPVPSGPIIKVGDTQWEILVYPRGNERCKDGWIRVSVRCVAKQEPKKEVRALYSVAAVSQAGEVKHKLEEEAIFFGGDGWGFDNFMSLERLSGFPDDVVVFEASVTVLGQEVMIPPKHQMLEDTVVKSAAQDLAADFRALWKSGLNADATLKAGDGELRVHRLVLSARSPVFARMFSGELAEMAEGSSGVVNIEDVDVDIMRHLCEFVYTGAIEDGRLWEDAQVAGAVLQAAAKYDVGSLVCLCAAKVAAKVTVESVSEWLILASQIGPQAEALRARCLDYVASHLAEVQGTEGWVRLMQNARVVSEVAPLLFQAISPAPAKKRRVARRAD